MAYTIVPEERAEPEDLTGVQIGRPIQGIKCTDECIHAVDEEAGDLDAVYGANPDLTTPELNKDTVLTMPQQPQQIRNAMRCLI